MHLLLPAKTRSKLFQFSSLRKHSAGMENPRLESKCGRWRHALKGIVWKPVGVPFVAGLWSSHSRLSVSYQQSFSVFARWIQKMSKKCERIISLKHCLCLPLHNDAALTQHSNDRAVPDMEHVRICWCTGLCTASCTLHVGLSTAFNSGNCCFSVSRTVNELFPLCLNYFYSSRTAPSVILMFTMCLFMDVFSTANCSSTLGTDAAASLELKWISPKLDCVTKSAFLNRLQL